jgi:hypothetical protein
VGDGRRRNEALGAPKSAHDDYFGENVLTGTLNLRDSAFLLTLRNP